MSRTAVIEAIEKEQLRSEIPNFEVGDTIKVHLRIIEGNKERVQVFTGTVISKKGSGISETFSVYRVAYGAAVERVFTLHSPRIAKIEVVRKGKTRRGKLYYLRGAFGKAAKVKGRIMSNAAKEKIAARQREIDEKNVAVQAKEAAPEAAEQPSEKAPEEPKNDSTES